MLRLVNAFPGRTDTRKVSDWELSPSAIHLIGVRRSEKTNKFDDLFVLLIKGLVFKFQGSTDPGATSNPLGAPFLVQGQHDYHFGWHKSQHLALRPSDNGVLVVRSKGDFRLDDADVSKGLEANSTIHIHWGGKGQTFDVNNWSEGCQVLNGSAYIDPSNQKIDCSSFVATNNGEVASNPSKTRGVTTWWPTSCSVWEAISGQYSALHAADRAGPGIDRVFGARGWSREGERAPRLIGAYSPAGYTPPPDASTQICLVLDNRRLRGARCDRDYRAARAAGFAPRDHVARGGRRVRRDAGRYHRGRVRGQRGQESGAARTG